MGLFSKLEITKEDSDKINSLLPQKYQKEQWDFKDVVEQVDTDYSRLYIKFQNHVSHLEKKTTNSIRRLESLKNNMPTILVSKVKIFNTEIHDAKPLGMVDVGIVRKFTTAGTGNRFETGLIGYVIEGAIDKQWANSNEQFNSVQEAKLELINKAVSIYPETNMIFKFEIDFRELGSSGNVFLYLRGTACKGKNEAMENAIKQLEIEKNELEKSLPLLENELLEAKKIKGSIPKNKAELKKFLGK